MSDKPSIDAIFCAAIEIESPDERQALRRAGLWRRTRTCGSRSSACCAPISHGRQLPGRSASEPVATVDEPAHAKRPARSSARTSCCEQIGEGGMGTVWMAEQTEPVKRLVALKLIKAGMDSQAGASPGSRRSGRRWR